MANDNENLEESNQDISVEEESIEGLELEIPQESSPETIEESDTSSENQEEEKSDENTEEIPIQKKQNKIKKILIIVAGVLGGFLLIGLILYFIGIFDPEPMPDPIQNKNPTEKASDTKDKTVIEPEKKQYQFKMNDIDKKRLNRKLSLLTKHEIIVEKKTDSTKKEIMASNAIELPIPQEEKREISQKDQTSEHLEKKEIISKERDEKIRHEEKMDLPDSMVEEGNDIQMEMNEKKEIVQPVDKPKEDDNPKSKVNDNLSSKEKAIEEQTQNMNKDNQEITGTSTEHIDDNRNQEEIIISESRSENPTQERRDNTETQTETSEKIENIDEKVEEVTAHNSTIKEDIIKGKSFLKFAQIATIKRQLYLSFLHQIREIDKRISVCRNDVNNIQIFMGPFNNEKERKEVLIRINQHIVDDAFAIDFTQEEFDKRCNF